jgi:transcriptional regulator with XRE-family HTH domain
VRELRERHGWSQNRRARESGMTQSAIARFEAGGTVPTLAVLERLAAARGVSLKVGFEPRTDAA